MMDIKESILNAQFLRKLKNYEVSEQSGISGTYYSTLRSGAKVPSLDLVKTLADVFNMKVSEFIALGESK